MLDICGKVNMYLGNMQDILSQKVANGITTILNGIDFMMDTVLSSESYITSFVDISLFEGNPVEIVIIEDPEKSTEEEKEKMIPYGNDKSVFYVDSTNASDLVSEVDKIIDIQSSISNGISNDSHKNIEDSFEIVNNNFC